VCRSIRKSRFLDRNWSTARQRWVSLYVRLCWQETNLSSPFISPISSHLIWFHFIWTESALKRPSLPCLRPITMHSVPVKWGQMRWGEMSDLWTLLVTGFQSCSVLHCAKWIRARNWVADSDRNPPTNLDSDPRHTINDCWPVSLASVGVVCPVFGRRLALLGHHRNRHPLQLHSRGCASVPGLSPCRSSIDWTAAGAGLRRTRDETVLRFCHLRRPFTRSTPALIWPSGNRSTACNVTLWGEWNDAGLERRRWRKCAQAKWTFIY